MESNKLSVVIVTFRSDSKIYTCLNSIPKDTSIFVVENSNNINFKHEIERKYPNVKCILTGSNKGYSIANNIGLELVKTRYALVLSPDTLLEKNVIKNFLEFTKKKSDFWIVGPFSGQSKNYEKKQEDFLEVNDLRGFAMFLNMNKFNNKFFDENFFLYFEEIDLCRRVKNQGGKIYLVKNIIISHDGASSVEKINFIEYEKNRNWHWMWSTFYFHKKHKNFTFALIMILPKLISSIFKSVYYQLIFKKDYRDIYRSRINGILNSILGKKSWYRPSLD